MMHFLKKTTVFPTLISVALLAGCGGGSSGGDDANNDSPDNDNNGNNTSLYSITISPEANNIYLPTQFSATGKYDDGTEEDITSKVTWTTVTPDIATFDATGMATPVAIGSTAITAGLNGITSEEITLNTVESMVCGHITGQPLSKNANGGIDNADSYGASDNCIKTREIVDSNDDKNKWFTSNPTKAVVEHLGYTEDDTVTNSGDTYSRLSSGDGFPMFRQDGDGVLVVSVEDPHNEQIGVNGQYDRWCQKLAKINFAGQSNWRRTTISELKALAKSSTNGMADFNWPLGLSYTSTNGSGQRNGTYLANSLKNDSQDFYYGPDGAYASCVSVQD